MEKTVTVEISCDASPFLAFANLVKSRLEVIETPLSIPNSALELIRLESDLDPARAHEVAVCLYPSDAFLAAVAAC